MNKIHIEIGSHNINLDPLLEEIRNLTKQEVSKAISQVDVKSMLRSAIDNITKEIEVVHVNIKNEEVTHYEVKKKHVTVPEIKYVREEVIKPVIREKVIWVNKVIEK